MILRLNIIIECILFTGQIFAQYSTIDTIQGRNLFVKEDNNFAGINLLDEELDKNRMFLCGETHYIKENEDLKIKFIKYLYYNAGTKIFFEELSSSYVYYINKYIKTGEEHVLDFLFSVGQYEYLESYIKRYSEFYMNLKEEEKTLMFGVDYEEYYWLPLKAMLDIITIHEAMPEKVTFGANLIKEINNEKKLPGKKKAIEFIDKLKFELLSNKADYKSFLKDDFDVFNRIVIGLEIGLKYPLKEKNAQESMEIREKFMYENMLAIIKKYPDQTYFGQFGKAHINKVEKDKWIWMTNWNSIATYLNNNEESPLKGKLLSIIYYNYLPPDPNDDFYNNGILELKERKVLLEKTGSNINIYNVKKLIDAFDYIIVNNIDAVYPYEPEYGIKKILK